MAAIPGAEELESRLRAKQAELCEMQRVVINSEKLDAMYSELSKEVTKVQQQAMGLQRDRKRQLKQVHRILKDPLHGQESMVAGLKEELAELTDLNQQLQTQLDNTEQQQHGKREVLDGLMAEHASLVAKTQECAEELQDAQGQLAGHMSTQQMKVLNQHVARVSELEKRLGLKSTQLAEQAPELQSKQEQLQLLEAKLESLKQYPPGSPKSPQLGA
eukprot:TRINITY_DN22308_c0_g1_i6.p2 TRINITY_DN22308_c0_g1~~TRINITY_DN22308_c0_g1_i6.p2  ORF type:complete len:217 (+),score=103.82 TRINITY_DN22308_c0_g1_i6:121-771(+)